MDSRGAIPMATKDGFRMKLLLNAKLLKIFVRFFYLAPECLFTVENIHLYQNNTVYKNNRTQNRLNLRVIED